MGAAWEAVQRRREEAAAHQKPTPAAASASQDGTSVRPSVLFTLLYTHHDLTNYPAHTNIKIAAGGTATATALVDTEAQAGEVATASVLSLVGLQARALAEAEEREAASLMGDLLELKLRRLEGRVRVVVWGDVFVWWCGRGG